MPDQVTNYKCPACGGTLKYSSQSGKLECEYCSSSFTVKEVEQLFAQKNQVAAENLEIDPAAEEAAARITKEEAEKRIHSKWDGSTIGSDWGELGENVCSYICPSCGAELICETTTVATGCPYCGNPTIVPGQIKDALKPDYIIPFKLDKKAAEAALKQHYQKKLFLPKTFSTENNIKKIKGVYVPFWLFDSETKAECQFEGTRSRSHRSGDYIITDTDHFDVYRYGNVTFTRVPTDASKKMPDDLMDSLEPYNYSELKEFSASYLPGYMADKFDVESEECSARADKRCTTSAVSFMRGDVSGYTGVTTKKSDVYISRGKVQYAFLPVWMLKTKWQGKDYLFAMNGQTGKIVGDLPVDKKKYRLWFFGIAIVVAAALYFLGVGNFFVDLIAVLFS